MPKFALLCYEDEDAGPKPPSPEWQALWDAYVRLDEEAKAAGVLVDSQPLAPSSTAMTVSVRDGRTEESLGLAQPTPLVLTGYYLLQVDDQAEALAWARKIPAVRTGRVEVRRIVDGPEDG